MVNSRLDTGEDMISEIKERKAEKSQTETHRERKRALSGENVTHVRHGQMI